MDASRSLLGRDSSIDGSVKATLRSNRVRSTIPGSDPNSLFHGRDEYLAVADAASPGCVLDGFDGAVGKLVLYNYLDLHLWQEVDDIFGTAVEFGMTFLAAEALHLGDGDAADPDVMQGVLHVVELERFDDGFDLFHGIALSALRLALAFDRSIEPSC